jgi:hypothetical protein
VLGAIHNLIHSLTSYSLLPSPLSLFPFPFPLFLPQHSQTAHTYPINPLSLFLSHPSYPNCSPSIPKLLTPLFPAHPAYPNCSPLSPPLPPLPRSPRSTPIPLLPPLLPLPPHVCSRAKKPLHLIPRGVVQSLFFLQGCAPRTQRAFT